MLIVPLPAIVVVNHDGLPAEILDDVVFEPPSDGASGSAAHHSWVDESIK